MTRMIRQKKEWRCSNCSSAYIKWEGTCRKCKKAGTLVEFQLVPVKIKPKPTLSQKQLMRRSKNSERDEARHMIAVDGIDPLYAKIASSTGRVGHITNMRIDGISLNYVMENKNRVLPKWLIDAWILILQRAEDFQKHALLHLDPPNAPKEYPINGVKKKTSSMYVITQARHDELIGKERELDAIKGT